MSKTAVILFNLGGPDNQEAVEPFLFNLFNDPAIIKLPKSLRWILAKIISARRADVAKGIYQKLGGGSPILKNTKLQAAALSKILNASDPAREYKCFVSMRYWHPFSQQTANEVKNFGPNNVVLLPLYPQYSTTTTASSVLDWLEATKSMGVNVATKALCCYPAQNGFIKSLAETTRQAYQFALKQGKPRILFSAHGLPKKIIERGDPYQMQCEMTVEALRRELNIADLDSILCFQSRVGPLEWIKPSTDDEVRRAGKDGKPVIMVPVAFTSDHSETLVELDIEYRELASVSGVPAYIFVPAVGTAPDFIKGLANLVWQVEKQSKPCVSATGARICATDFKTCPFGKKLGLVHDV